MKRDETLILTSRDLEQVSQRIGVDRLMDELIEMVAGALRQYDASLTEIVQRGGFSYDQPHPGVLEWMPAMVVGERAVIKIVSYNPGNPGARGMPTIVSTIGLYDIATGRLMTLLDGNLPTALRTGAASAVATKLLARRGSSVIGLVGCGAQAVTQLHAISRSFDLRSVLVYDTNVRSSHDFADRVAFLGLPVHAVDRDVLEREADILCTATSTEPGSGPVVDDQHFLPWIHVNAVGSDLPGKTELPVDFLRRSLVCPDFVEQALVEGEAQQLTRDELGPTLSDLVKAGDGLEVWQGRPTVFDSTGYALEDMVVAELFLRHASTLGLGRTVPLQALGGDPKNPYARLELPGNADRLVAAKQRRS